jgi:hypothetical protein
VVSGNSEAKFGIGWHLRPRNTEQPMNRRLHNPAGPIGKLRDPNNLAIAVELARDARGRALCAQDTETSECFVTHRIPLAHHAPECSQTIHRPDSLITVRFDSSRAHMECSREDRSKATARSGNRLEAFPARS